MALAGRMAYRGDFIISTTMMFIVEFIVPLVTYLVYKSGASFPGWSLYEVLLIQGVFLLAKGIASPTFFGMIFNTLGRVREGTFDLLLIKPRSTLFMLIVTAFDSEDLGKLAGGIILFTISLAHLPPPSWWQWLQFLLLLVLSLVVLFSFSLLMSGSVFKWVGNSRVYEIFDSVTSFGLYPISIFSKALQTIITWVIPITLIGSYPAAVLLGKPSGGVVGACVASIIFLSVSLSFWRFMLKSYTSAGG